MAKNIHAAIIGASGYGAGELLRILSIHPDVKISALVSSSSDGALIESLHPHLRGCNINVSCTKELGLEQFAQFGAQGIIFCALPHGTSGNTALSLLRNPSLSKTRIIDLSGDLRLKQQELAKAWYPETEFDTEERASITYGLPELFSNQIRTARIVSNPGCLASAAILSLAPLAAASLLSREIVIDAKTGTSGAGRTPQSAFHHPGMNANCFAYKVLEHRHEPEIREVLGDPFEKRFSTLFVPHVIPSSRGIYVTCYVELRQDQTLASLYKHYREFFAESPFIQITEDLPELRSVLGGNFCQIALKKRGQRLVVVAALDNLVKGMAGAAVQNMNLMFGLDERAGLLTPGLGII